MEKIYVAVIGCGTIANSAHIPSYMKNDKVEILYFCDIIPERADTAVEKYKCGKAIIDYHEALNDPKVDAISVCTPNHMHAQISVDALKAGKQVLCEKPSARTYEEAKKMQEAQASTGNMLSIGVVNRFNAGVNKIKEFIDNGELGEIYHVYVSFRAQRSIPGLGGAFTTKAIAGGGVLIDWGVHYLDIVMYCLKDPETLTASGKGFCKLAKDMREYKFKNMWAGPPDYSGTYDVDDFITGFIRTKGATISLNGAWAQNIGVGETYIDFIGSKAGIRLQYGADFKIFKIGDDGELEGITPQYDKWDMFQKEIDSFVDTVKTKQKLPSNIDTAIITTRMMQALYDSSEQGREIVLE